VAAAAGYIGLMGLGMTAMQQVGGVRYGDPEMMQLIGPVEVLLTLWTLWAVRRQGGLAAAGLPLVRPRQWLWIVPFALPVLAGLASLAQLVLRGPLPAGKPALLLAAVVTTGLVGFSEELMFRGVLLRGAWRQVGLYRAMLVSALGFMLLHAVNVLGGQPLAATGAQLASTFLFGLAMAPVAVRLGTLWPLVLVHWGWDLLLFGHGALGEPPPALAMAFLPAELLVAAAGWWSLRRERGLRLDQVEGARPG
jgi:membrane protease YdiL (CAAX protease family)